MKAKPTLFLIPPSVQKLASMNVHFSSATPEWETPQALFDELSHIFGGFTLDPCATTQNAKCTRFFTREDDGLSQPWTGKVFVNPPYGREIGKWVRKAYEESQNGALVVCLLPARVDTRWWH
jgi:site-specific DNA-methyltransferase (adenine-specific)